MREFSDSSSTSRESLDEDSAHRDGNFWEMRVHILGLPSWISWRREADTPSSGSVWGEKRGTGECPLYRLRDF